MTKSRVESGKKKKRDKGGGKGRKYTSETSFQVNGPRRGGGGEKIKALGRKQNEKSTKTH